MVCNIEGGQEEELYVDYSALLDDGEAMSLAIAVSRGYVLATDERKARRLFIDTTQDPKRLIATSELLRQWADAERIPEDRVRIALQQIEKRARYQPPTNDSNCQWWIDASRL